jgi:hypothetical protein
LNGKADNVIQNMVKALGTAGYKTQVQTLSHYHNDYGLEANEEEEEEEEDEDEEMEDGEDGSESDEGSDL